MYLLVSVSYCILNMLSFEFPLPFHPIELKRTHIKRRGTSRTTFIVPFSIRVERRFVGRIVGGHFYYGIWKDLSENVFELFPAYLLSKNELKHTG